MKSVMVFFPVICLIVSVALLIYGCWRKRNKLQSLQLFIISGVMLLVPVALAVFLFLSGALGIGPIAN